MEAEQPCAPRARARRRSAKRVRGASLPRASALMFVAAMRRLPFTFKPRAAAYATID